MAPSGNDYLRGVRKDLFCTISTYALFVFHKWETFVYIRIVFTNFLHLYVFMNQSALRTIQGLSAKFPHVLDFDGLGRLNQDLLINTTKTECFIM